MKKKILIAVIVIILLVLLIPIPMRLKDGGTIEYKALIYTISKVHKLNHNSASGYDNGLIIKIFGKEITSQFVFNKRNEFPLSGCGKRNNIALTEEGIPNNSLIVVSGLGIENYIVENNKKKIKKL